MVENWCHVFACSNSLKALKMEDTDRRWYYPQLSEEGWVRAQFVEFYEWLEHEGVGIVKQWAFDFGDYIGRGDHSPMTERKKELIYESMSDAQKEAARLAGLMNELDRPVCVAMRDVVLWLKRVINGRIYENEQQIRKAMIGAGGRRSLERYYVDGMKQWFICNHLLTQGVEREERKEAIVGGRVLIGDIVEPPL